MPHNAARYCADQLAHIKARIAAAWRERIDPNGPPAAARDSQTQAGRARKGLDEAGTLAQLVLDLDGVRRRLALEATVEGDASPLHEQLGMIVAELCEVLEALVAEEGDELLDQGRVEAGGMAAAAVAGMLRKAGRQRGPVPPPGIDKLAAEILPRLDMLQKRVDEIARTPLPPQTIARGLAGISKREDGGAAPPQGDDIVAALARMSEDERTLTLIKAAHSSPIDPFARTR
jgi:hypothetical protein